MRKHGFLPPVSFDDVATFDAMVQTIIDARALEMSSTGGFGVERDSDKGGIERIVASTFCGFFGEDASDRFDDLFEQCAYLADHLANGHVFADGNKRTAVRMSLSLLAMRGVLLDVDDSPDPSENEVYQWIQALVEKKISSENLAYLFRWKASRRDAEA